jgi:uncharacterized protein YdhG (YjbR/CyaY superfamily)
MKPKKITKKKIFKGFSDDERGAMKERILELQAEAGRGSRDKRAAGEKDLLAKIAAMPEPDRTMAKKIHKIITTAAPSLMPKTWYSMPAYAKGDKVVCFFQNASKFKARYSTLGFSDLARLDDGDMWPTSFALKKLTAKEEAKIARLVKKAVK